VNRLKRNELGRILGTGFEFNNFQEDESYVNVKVKGGGILFPKHNDDQSSEVRTYFLSAEELAALRNK
jgi:hypothetical protein